MNRLFAAAFVTLAAGTLAAQQVTPVVSVPAATGATPAECTAAIAAYVAKRQIELAPPTADKARQMSAERAEMFKGCAARFDSAKVADQDLPALAELYLQAGDAGRAGAIVTRMLAAKDLPPAARAAAISTAVTVTLREPKGDERNARLETLVDELDRLPADAFDRKFAAHNAMGGYYRADDIDAGIIKHSTWIIDAAKTFTPDQWRRLGPAVVQAYVNMAEAWAGQGMNDKAIALLKDAITSCSAVPGVAARVTPTLERYQLVGTKGAPISAPVWLNAAAGTSMALDGKVTLLEFTAHWCGPCRESYPGINRLRAKYGSQGFQVVMATRLYGYFGADRNLAADVEIAHDKEYFAEHGLNLPVAIAPLVSVKIENNKVVYVPGPDPNETPYKVGGIPQIQLIDRRGTIRLIMVGYDDANEPKLSAFIESLLKEK